MIKMYYKNYKIIYEDSVYLIEYNMSNNILAPENNILAPELNKSKNYNYNFGRPIWYLFHTLAIKIKDERFFSFKNEFLNIIVYVCKNIVCDTCAKHSSDYLEKIGFLNIDTKEKLNYELFYFHNEVNKELISKYNRQIDLFLYENLESTYRNQNTQMVIQSFLKYDFYAKKYHVKNEENVLYLTKWFSDNIDNFDD